MELELLKYLEPITEEEQKYLDGKNSVEKDLYTSEKQFVIDSHLTQETFAEKAGISVNTVSRIEGGQAAMSMA